MEIKTPEEMYEILDAIEDLTERAVRLGNLQSKLNGYGSIDEDDICIRNGMFIVKTSYYHGCGEYDYHDIEITVEDLFDENAEEKLRSALHRKREKEEEKKRLEAEKQEKLQEKRKYEQYLKLKAKFEGGFDIEED